MRTSVGREVPRNTCPNPGALFVIVTSFRRPGPHHMLSFDSPSATGPSSARTNDGPRSNVVNAASPKRCGMSIRWPIPVGYAYGLSPAGTAIGDSANARFSVLMAIGRTSAEKRPHRASAPADAAIVEPRPCQRAPSLTPHGRAVLCARRTSAGSMRNCGRWVSAKARKRARFAARHGSAASSLPPRKSSTERVDRAVIGETGTAPMTCSSLA